MNLWLAEKRVLALDGGGVRGIVSIAFLERIEALLREASGKGDAFRLSDHFHLIGGTSTGAIIAAALASGRTVAEIKAFYLDLAPRVFRRHWARIPLLQSRFVHRPLMDILMAELGDMNLDDPRIATLVAIIMKRVDTGSPWIVSNVPTQPYWEDREDGLRRGNRHYRLASLVRASTAAPFFFGPESIPISSEMAGNFIDGGVSPYNTPVLPLLMLATMKSYGLCWPLGPDRLSMVSIGAGRHRHRTNTSWTPALKFAVDTLRGLIEDCQATSLMLMQWLGESESPWHLNRDIGNLHGDYLGGQPLLSFQRYDLMLEREWLNEYFDLSLTDLDVRQLRRIDSPLAMADREVRGPAVRKPERTALSSPA
jgi:hypothetical protein